jgi:uncharacterized repeat protein (TIGR02543 family)
MALLLSSLFTFASTVQPVKAQGTIYIMPDGSINPPTANITTPDRVTYTFTGNNYLPIVVQRSNIIIDGRGYTLRASVNEDGFSLSGMSNITIKNTTITNCHNGIFLSYSSNNTISGINATANSIVGIYLYYSSNNTISGNSATANNFAGILLRASSDNMVSQNNVTLNYDNGIWLYSYSDRNTVSNNNVNNNSIHSQSYNSGIMVEGYSSRNMITGNEVHYNPRKAIELYGGAFYNTVIGNNVSGGSDLVEVWNAQDNTIIGNTVTRATWNGYIIYGSSNITLTGNNVTLVGWNNRVWPEGAYGISVESCSNITLRENYASANTGDGIYLSETSYSTIVGNTLTGNGYSGIEFVTASNNHIDSNRIDDNSAGLRLYQNSQNNVIYHNDFVNNNIQASIDATSTGNAWNDVYSSGGNYWSDYSTRYPGARELDDSGIWNTPYVINANNRDNYPLMQPFTRNQYTLTVNIVGSGSVNRNNTGPYHYGDVVQLTAVPATGWSFQNWSGDLTGSTNPTTLEINWDKAVTATFTQNTYSLTVTTVGSGSVSRNQSAPYHYGDVVLLTATPAAGWTFSAWSGGLTGSTNPASITITSNMAVTATFTQNVYTLTINIVGSGSVNRNNTGSYHYGDAVELTAVPSAGWSFIGWSGDLSGSTNPETITMTGNKAVTATFTQDVYTLTVTTVGSGTVNLNNSGPYYYGDIVELTAVSSTGWSFDHWDGDLSGSANPTTILINGDKTVTATFTQNVYTLTLATVGSGSVNLNSTGPYYYGDVVQLTAVPTVGWSLDHWSGDLSGSTNPATITMASDKSVTAVFTQNQYTLDITIAGSGSVTKVPDQATYTYGTSVQLTATAETGWTFAGWSGDLSGTQSPVDLVMDDNKIVTATFIQNEYTLDVSIVGSGSVTKAPDQLTYHLNDVVQLTATPLAGWSFSGWSGNLTGSTNPASITITGNMVVNATFTLHGDVDGDGDVDSYDLSILQRAYGSTPEKPNWNSSCDINGDDKVDVSDLFDLGKNYGETVQTTGTLWLPMVLSMLGVAVGKRKLPRKPKN